MRTDSVLEGEDRDDEMFRPINSKTLDKVVKLSVSDRTVVSHVGSKSALSSQMKLDIRHANFLDPAPLGLCCTGWDWQTADDVR